MTTPSNIFMITPEILHQSAITILEKYYPSGAHYRPKVNEEVQLNEIEQLKKNVKYEQFFFVLDLVGKKLTNVNGFSEWLGWADQSFSFFQYFQILHSHFYDSIMQVAESSFEMANSQKFEIHFMKNSIVALIALRHKNGKYFLVKRSLYPFQIDENGAVTAYLNYFVLIGEYQELGIRIANGSQIFAMNEQTFFKQKQAEVLKQKKKVFKLNKTELQIIRLISENPELTLKNISEQFGINQSTLESTHNSRILKKMRDHFNTEIFKTLKDVAIFLKMRGVV